MGYSPTDTIGLCWGLNELVEFVSTVTGTMDVVYVNGKKYRGDCFRYFADSNLHNFLVGAGRTHDDLRRTEYYDELVNVCGEFNLMSGLIYNLGYGVLIADNNSTQEFYKRNGDGSVFEKIARVSSKKGDLMKKQAMIIDTILDRKSWEEDAGEYGWYDASTAKYIYDQATYFGFDDLARAFDSGSNEDAKRELCRYIDEQGYNPAIKDYVNSVDWVDPFWVDATVIGSRMKKRAYVSSGAIENDMLSRGLNYEFDFDFAGADVEVNTYQLEKLIGNRDEEDYEELFTVLEQPTDEHTGFIEVHNPQVLTDYPGCTIIDCDEQGYPYGEYWVECSYRYEDVECTASVRVHVDEGSTFTSNTPTKVYITDPRNGAYEMTEVENLIDESFKGYSGTLKDYLTDDPINFFDYLYEYWPDAVAERINYRDVMADPDSYYRSATRKKASFGEWSKHRKSDDSWGEKTYYNVWESEDSSNYTRAEIYKDKYSDYQWYLYDTRNDEQYCEGHADSLQEAQSYCESCADEWGPNSPKCGFSEYLEEIERDEGISDSMWNSMSDKEHHEKARPAIERFINNHPEVDLELFGAYLTDNNYHAEARVLNDMINGTDWAGYNEYVISMDYIPGTSYEDYMRMKENGEIAMAKRTSMKKRAYSPVQTEPGWNDFNKKTNDWFGIPGATFVYHNDYADPDIVYNGVTLNYWDVMDAMWDFAQEDGITESITDEEYDEWLEKNVDLLHGILDDYAWSMQDAGRTTWHNAKKANKRRYVRKAMRKKARHDWNPAIFVGFCNDPVVGDWISLPVDDINEEVSKIQQMIFEEIGEDWGIQSPEDVECIIADSEFLGNLSEWDSPEEINSAVEEIEKVADYLPTEIIEWAFDEYPDMMEIADKLEDIWYIEASTDEELGYKYIEEIYGDNLEELGAETLARYFDYDKFGRDLSFDFVQIDGYFVREGKNGRKTYYVKKAGKQDHRKITFRRTR